MLNKHLTLEVLSNHQIAEDTYALTLSAPPEILREFVPGQFAHIELPGEDESRLLRRPISVNYVDFARSTLHFAYLLVGAGTRRLSKTAAGEKLDVLAPLGHGFQVEERHKRIWLVGGGIGIAPLYSLFDCYKDREYTAFLGYKSAKYAYEIEAFRRSCREVFVTSDDGTLGEEGFVTDVLARELRKGKPDLILSCGPTPMFRALKAVWEEAGGDIETQVSLEQHMGCGTGGCYTCTALVAGSMKRVCVDGPVFPIQEVSV